MHIEDQQFTQNPERTNTYPCKEHPVHLKKEIVRFSSYLHHQTTAAYIHNQAIDV